MALFLDFRRQENLDVYADGAISVPVTEYIRSDKVRGTMLARNIIDRAGAPVAATIDRSVDGTRVMVGVVVKEPEERINTDDIDDLLVKRGITDSQYAISMWLPYLDTEI